MVGRHTAITTVDVEVAGKPGLHVVRSGECLREKQTDDDVITVTSHGRHGVLNHSKFNCLYTNQRKLRNSVLLTL